MEKIKYETDLQMKDDRIQQLVRDMQILVIFGFYSVLQLEMGKEAATIYCNFEDHCANNWKTVFL